MQKLLIRAAAKIAGQGNHALEQQAKLLFSLLFSPLRTLIYAVKCRQQTDGLTFNQAWRMVLHDFKQQPIHLLNHVILGMLLYAYLNTHISNITQALLDPNSA